MNSRLKNILLVALWAAVLFGFSALQLLQPDKEYSESERRTLAQFPQITKERVASGRFMTEFDAYAMDQFPMRDRLRTLQAFSSRYLLLRGDNNGLYGVGNNVSKLDYPLKPSMIAHAAKRFRYVYDTCLAGTNCPVYLSVIPDKNYFLAPAGGYPMMDYAALVKDLKGQMDFAEYIDIFDDLSLEDYYETDQHWRQERLQDVAGTLAEGMGATLTGTFTKKELEKPFYGAYSGQWALPLSPDTIYYLTNDMLEACTVVSYDTGAPKPASLYDMEKAAGRDPYEMFLSGSDALLIVENPNSGTSRELVIFRDSFAGSLAPLLISGYAKVTLVDLRYIPGSMVGNFVDFQDQDVLFLYSTLILNNSLSLK